MLETRNLVFKICKKPFVITEGDGYVDRLLLRKNKKFNDVVSDYLAALTVEIDGKTPVSRDDILNLVSPDQVFLSIQCYMLNYGDVFEFEYNCQECNNSSVQSFDLNSLEFVELPLELQVPDPTIEVLLPRSKKKAVLGMLNGHKESILIQQILTTGIDLNQGDFLSLRSLDGSTDFSYEDVVKLPLADHKALRKARKQLACGYDTNINVTCDNCGALGSVNILMNKDFLLPTG